MEYFKNKNRDINILRIAFLSTSILFAVIIISTLSLQYFERQKFNTETWAISPESGEIIKLTKIKYTKEERIAEYKAHVRDYIQHWYSFDQYTFKSNLNYAANLIDKKTRDKEIAKYQEENTLAKLQERDIILNVSIREITVDITKRPYSGTFTFEQTLRTTQNSDKRIIEGIFEIEDTEGRSYSNPHAAIITGIQITRKEGIK